MLIGVDGILVGANGVYDQLVVDASATTVFDGNMTFSSAGLINNGAVTFQGANIGSSNSDWVNNNSITVSAGITTVGSGSTLVNNSVVDVSDGATLAVSNGELNGGTFNTSGSGKISPVSGKLNGITNAGLVMVPNSGYAWLQNTITNNAQIATEDINSRIYIEDAVSLSGVGEVVFGEGSGNQVIGVDGILVGSNGLQDELIIPVGAQQTWSGLGTIGVPLTLEGEMYFGAGPVTIGQSVNNLSSITVLDNGVVALNSSAIVNGGMLTTEGDGVVESRGAELDGVTNTGALGIPLNQYLRLDNTFTNNGQIVAQGGSATIYIEDEISLEGVGSISFAGTNNTIQGVDGALVGANGIQDEIFIRANSQQVWSGLGTINVPLTVEGETFFGAGPITIAQTVNNLSQMTVLNSGGLVLSSSAYVSGGTLNTEGNGIMESYGATMDSVTNAGDLVVPSSQYLRLINTFSNNGQVTAQGSSAIIYVEDALNLNGMGILSFIGSNHSIRGVDGVLVAANGVEDSLSITNGQGIRGDVTINVPLTSSGVIAPGNSPGLMTFGAASILNNDSRLIMEIYGSSSSQYDRILASAGLVVGGELELLVDPAYVPSIVPGDSYVLIDSSVAILGSFNNLRPGERVIGSNGTTFIVEYGPASVDPTAVMLTSFEPVSVSSNDAVTSLSGEASGGVVTIVVNGVEFVVVTQPGDTAADIVSALAIAINGQFPGQARAIDNVLELTGLTIDLLSTTDLGLSGSILAQIVPENVPFAGELYQLLLALLLFIFARSKFVASYRPI